MTCSYCTLVRMKIVVYLLPCNFLGSTVIKQRAPAQPSTSHLLILTSLQPCCVGLLSEHTCLAQPAPIKPFKVKTKSCVVVRKKQHLDLKEMSGINFICFSDEAAKLCLRTNTHQHNQDSSFVCTRLKWHQFSTRT